MRFSKRDVYKTIQAANHRTTFRMQNAAMSLARSFEQPYQGPALDNFISVLYKHMDEYDPSMFYGRNIPIIQSSGTGKSKLIRDLSKKAQC
jgi:hypothetical protein